MSLLATIDFVAECYPSMTDGAAYLALFQHSQIPYHQRSQKNLGCMSLLSSVCLVQVCIRTNMGGRQSWLLHMTHPLTTSKRSHVQRRVS
jgi:hypothetical protein